MGRSVVIATLCLSACINDVVLDPRRPTNVVARPGNNQVTLSWAEVTGATDYNVYWTDDGGVPSVEASERFRGAANPFVHAELSNGTLYRYVVTALNPKGESPPSGVAEAIPAAVEAIGVTDIGFTLCCADCCPPDPSIGYALWVEDGAGSYVDTVTYYAFHREAPGGYANADLPLWTAAAASLVDGLSEATRYNDDAVAYRWDGKDRAGADLARGTYSVKLELTDWDLETFLTTVTLELGAAPVNTTATSPLVAGDITVAYQP